MSPPGLIMAVSSHLSPSCCTLSSPPPPTGWPSRPSLSCGYLGNSCSSFPPAEMDRVHLCSRRVENKPERCLPRCSQKLLVSGVCDYFYTNSTSKHSKPGRMIIRGIKSWIPSNEVGFSTSCSNVTSSRQLHWSKMAPDISLYFHIVMNKSRPGNFKEGRCGSSLQKRGPLSRFRPVFPTLFHEGGRLKDEKIWFAVFVSNLDSLKTFACVCPKRPSGDSLPPVAGNQLQHVSFLFLLTEATATLILIRSYLFTSLPADKQQLTPSATGSLTPPSGRVTNIPIKHR